MGQQQILLIVLAVVIVGVAITVGISVFRSSAVDAARDAVALDLQDLAGRAQAYYRKPGLLGGGGGSFNSPAGSVIDIGSLTSRPSNNNGRYFVDAGTSTANQIVIVGKGFEIVGTDSVEIRATVTSNRFTTEIIR